MTYARHPRRRALITVVLSLTGLLVVAGAAWIGMTAGSQPQRAEASNHLCGTTHDELDEDEEEFLQHFRSWRTSQGYQVANVEVSGALNAAAAWFAQHLVEVGPQGPNAHIDAYGRDWRQRALDCGYLGTVQGIQMVNYGSGEGIAYLQGSSVDLSPHHGVYGGSIGGFQHQGVTYPGSGAHLDVGGSLPARCVGIAKYRNANGTGVAWIVVLARWPSGNDCPESNVAPPATVTPSPTQEATPTPTSTPTESPTATPTPTPEPVEEWQSYVPAIGRDGE